MEKSGIYNDLRRPTIIKGCLTWRLVGRKRWDGPPVLGPQRVGTRGQDGASGGKEHGSVKKTTGILTTWKPTTLWGDFTQREGRREWSCINSYIRGRTRWGTKIRGQL